jgi:hypothetical protein
LLKRQETLLAVTGQVGDPSYSSTKEAVHTLKCSIRRKVDRSHNDSEIHQSIMMDMWYIKGDGDGSETHIIS